MSNLRNERDFSFTATGSLETRTAELENVKHVFSRSASTLMRSAPKRIHRKTFWHKLITFSFK